MTTTPRKRPAQPGWDTPTTSKALRVLQPTDVTSERMRGTPSRVQPQPTRPPLAELRQPKSHPVPQHPGVRYAKPSHMGHFDSIGRQSHLSWRAPVVGPTPGTSQAAAVHRHAPMNWAGPCPQVLAQIQQPVMRVSQGEVCKPAIRHSQHPESRLGRNFHWVPYPLGLMHYDSWFKLHHRPEDSKERSAVCPVCYQQRKITPHMRKIFLVAERLLAEDGTTSMHLKSKNEELNWAVNYELGILEPFVEDPEQVPGGKNSQKNTFYPYANEYEMQLAFEHISISEEITEATWALWIGVQLDLQKMLGGDDLNPGSKGPSLKEDGLKILENRALRQKTPEIETIDLTGSPPPKAKTVPPILTPPSTQANAVSPLKPIDPPPYFDKNRRIVSYKTLQDFYELLDKIERTSYVGAKFLEAYAEKLRDDLCKDCWFKRNVNLDLY